MLKNTHTYTYIYIYTHEYLCKRASFDVVSVKYFFVVCVETGHVAVDGGGGDPLYIGFALYRV
jgi:hypothetical protein